MIRAQIYLTTTEKQKLRSISQETGKSQSELIREAIDLFIESNLGKKQNKLAAIHAVKGLWTDRTDLPDFSLLRKEFDKRGNSDD